MDSGHSFWKKTVSRKPVEYIQKIQQEVQANFKKTGLIHLVKSHDRITSQIIPGAMMAAALPMIGYGLFVLYTENAPNS